MTAKVKTIIYGACAIVLWSVFLFFSNPHATIDEMHPDYTENFYYYISEDEVMALPGTPVSDLLSRVGDPDEIYEGRYTYHYLTIVSPEGRHRGIAFLVEGSGMILDIYPLAETTLGRNWFRHLPLYSTFAATNLFNCSSSHSSESSIRWSPFLMLLVALFAFFFTAATFHGIYLISSDGNPTARDKAILTTEITLLCASAYILLLPWLNVTHSIWLISLPVYVILIPTSITGGWHMVKELLHYCPECHKIDCYNPEKVVFNTERLPGCSINLSLTGIRSESAVRSLVADKTVTDKIWHRMEGKCSKCGHEDTTEYWTTQPITFTTKCPYCETPLIIERTDITKGTGASRSRDYGPASMDMRTAEQVGYDKFKGDVTQRRQTFTTRWITFTYSERCPKCSYSFGPRSFTSDWEDSTSREVTERRTARLAD